MATPIGNNTEGLQEILQQANALPNAGSGGTVQKYGKLVVFGDSVGEGANNNSYSYVDILNETGLFSSVVKACKGGATIGPYQSDLSASGYDLISQIERYTSDVQDADIILLEYGGNDVTVAMNGNVAIGTAGDSGTLTTVCGYVQKALSRLRELNTNAHIHWVNVFSTDWDYINLLVNDAYADTAMLFMATALRKCASSCVSVIQAFYSYEWCLSSDYTHPNTEGHKLIATLILNGLFKNNYVFPHERVITMSGTREDPSSFFPNGSFNNLKKLIEANVPTRMISFLGTGSDETLVQYNLTSSNGYFIGYTSVGHNGSDMEATQILLFPDGTVTVFSKVFGSGN